MKCFVSVENFLERPTKSFWGCLLKSSCRLKVLCHLQQRHMYGNCIRPRSGRVCFPAVNSDSSHKQLAGQCTSWCRSYVSLPAFQSFLTLYFRDQVKIQSHKMSKWYLKMFWRIIIEKSDFFFFFKPTLGLFRVDSSFLNSMLTKYKWRGRKIHGA